MPKVVCPNGHALDISTVPAQGEFFYASTAQWDQIIDGLTEAVTRVDSRDRKLVGEALSDALAGTVRYFYRCGKCGGLSFPSEEPPIGYLPELPEEER